MQFTINSFRQLFPDKIFYLKIPWISVKSLTFPWQLSNSLIFPGFPDKSSPWKWRKLIRGEESPRDNESEDSVLDWSGEAHPGWHGETAVKWGTLWCLQKKMATYRSCVLVERQRRCLTLSNPVPWQNWMAAYLGYTLRMKTLFRGWPVMVNDTHTRKRRMSLLFCCCL